MGSNFKYWLNSGKVKRQRQNCHHRSSHEETQYTLLQDCYDEYNDGGHALHTHNPTSYYEKKLEPGDTLLSLSLKFNCPVAELKRINGILRDNEIFARRSLKVPLKPGSVVTERLAGVHGSLNKDEDKLLINFDDPVTGGDELSGTSSCSNEDISSANHSKIVDEEEHIVNHRFHGQNTVDLLSDNTYVTNISTSIGTNERADTPSIILNESCMEDPSSPHMVQDLPEVSTESAAILSCSGADWGLKWPQLLICSLLLGFAGPILYVLYITEKQHKSDK